MIRTVAQIELAERTYVSNIVKVPESLAEGLRECMAVDLLFEIAKQLAAINERAAKHRTTGRE